MTRITVFFGWWLRHCLTERGSLSLQCSPWSFLSNYGLPPIIDIFHEVRRSGHESHAESWAPIAIGLESQGLLPQRDVMARQARSQGSQRFNLWTCRIRRIGCSVSAWKLWLEPNCLACGSRNCTVGLQCQIGWTNLDVPKPSKSKGPHQKSPNKAKENERNTNITWEFRRSWQSLWMRSFTLRWSAAKGRVTLYRIKKDCGRLSCCWYRLL